MEPQQEYTAKVIEKPIHAKPSLYAYYFELIKAIGKKYGYNIVVHGSMNRDLDLVAIPWNAAMGDKEQMIDEICEALGGTLLMKERSLHNPDGQRFTTTHHGRMLYIVNINRDIAHKFDGIKSTIKEHNDPQYYLDISVIGTEQEIEKSANSLISNLYKYYEVIALYKYYNKDFDITTTDYSLLDCFYKIFSAVGLDYEFERFLDFFNHPTRFKRIEYIYKTNNHYWSRQPATIFMFYLIERHRECLKLYWPLDSISRENIFIEFGISTF